MTVSKTNLIKMFVTASFMFGGLIAVGQTQTFAKSNKITSNVSMAKVNSDDRNVTLTGKHQIYTKAQSLKGAKPVTTKRQLQKLAKSVRSKDTFYAYRMATTNNQRVYYKIVSFEGKYRGWIYGGKIKNYFNGGIRHTDTTTDVSLSEEVRNTTYHLKSTGTSGDVNTWKAIPWTQYKAGLKTKDSTPYANDKLKVTAAKRMTRQYFQTYYYVEDTDHPEFNGWINKNAVEGPEKVITNTVNVPGPKETVTQTVTVPGPTKTVTVPAENKLTINYLTYRFDPSGKYTKATTGNDADWTEETSTVSSGIQKDYQRQFAKAIDQIKDKKELTSADLDSLGNGQVFMRLDDEWGEYQVSIRVNYDKQKNVAEIVLTWEDRQTTVSRAANYYLHVGDNFTPWVLLSDFVYQGYFVSRDRYPQLFTIIENTVDTSKPGTYEVKYYMNDYPDKIRTVPVTVQPN